MFAVGRQKQKVQQWLSGPIGKEEERVESVKGF